MSFSWNKTWRNYKFAWNLWIAIVIAITQLQLPKIEKKLRVHLFGGIVVEQNTEILKATAVKKMVVNCISRYCNRGFSFATYLFYELTRFLFLLCDCSIYFRSFFNFVLNFFKLSFNARFVPQLTVIMSLLMGGKSCVKIWIYCFEALV